MSSVTTQKLEKKPVKFSNLLLGAGLNMFEVRFLFFFFLLITSGCSIVVFRGGDVSIEVKERCCRVEDFGM